MNCPICPKPSDVNFGTLAVPARLGHFVEIIYNKYNDIYKVSHSPTHTRDGTVGTLKPYEAYQMFGYQCQCRHP